MDFHTIISTIYKPEPMAKLLDMIFVQSPSEFNAAESYAVMYELSPGLPLAFAVGYIIMVFGGKALMRQFSEGFNFKHAVTVWDFLLAVFSIAGAVVTVPFTMDLLMNSGNTSTTGFTRYLCHPPQGLYDGVVGYWVFVFILSKIPELLDTFFLVTQKKPIIFLHWYHHTSAMLFSWHAWILGSPAGLFFAAMNLFAHALMYSYYFLMNFQRGRTMVRPLAPLITTIQILQMVGGLIISVLCFIALDENNTAACPGLQPINVQAGTIMYFSFFILFCVLFKKMYLTEKKKKPSRKPEEEKKESNSFEGNWGNKLLTYFF